MTNTKKPSKQDLERGGYNPVPADTQRPKEQFGPLPSDDPEHVTAQDKEAERARTSPTKLARGDHVRRK